MGKRDDDRRRTRRALADAAVDQFLRRDYADVTVADIAEAAGVSRRTAYRHAPTKAELVAHHPREWMEVFDEALAALGDAPLHRRLRLGARAVVAHIEADPELTAAYARDTVRWVERIAAEIGADHDAGDPADRGGNGAADPRTELRSGILGAAVMGMIDRVCRVWAESGEPMGPLIEAGFDLLDPILGEPGSPPGHRPAT